MRNEGSIDDKASNERSADAVDALELAVTKHSKAFQQARMHDRDRESVCTQATHGILCCVLCRHYIPSNASSVGSFHAATTNTLTLATEQRTTTGCTYGSSIVRFSHDCGWVVSFKKGKRKKRKVKAIQSG
jgi:hypothetical protein